MTMDQATLVRCPSPTCTSAGGGYLFRGRVYMNQRAQIFNSARSNDRLADHLDNVKRIQRQQIYRHGRWVILAAMGLEGDFETAADVWLEVKILEEGKAGDMGSATISVFLATNPLLKLRSLYLNQVCRSCLFQLLDLIALACSILSNGPSLLHLPLRGWSSPPRLFPPPSG